MNHHHYIYIYIYIYIYALTQRTEKHSSKELPNILLGSKNKYLIKFYIFTKYGVLNTDCLFIYKVRCSEHRLSVYLQSTVF